MDIEQLLRRIMQGNGDREWTEGDGDNEPGWGNPRRDIKIPRVPKIAVALGFLFLLLLLGFSGIVEFYTDLLWFGSLGYDATLWRRVLPQFMLFGIVALLAFAAYALNWRIAVKIGTEEFRASTGDDKAVLVKPLHVTIAAAVFAVMAGIGAHESWPQVLQFLHRVPFGDVDPVFGRDIGFYLFSLPFFRVLQRFLLNLVLLSLTGSAVVGELSNDGFALMDGSAIAGIAYVIETYGIIYNKALLERAGYTQADITNFASLKAVAEDITARSDELGFSAFASAGMEASSDWRFKTHLANMPIYYEYLADGIGTTTAIKGTYLDNYKQIWDLYINNSTTSPNLLSTKTGEDAVAEMLTEQAVFYQNGTWAYGDLADLGDDNLGMLPIYINVEGEESQGLCTGTENYWCVNKNAAPEDIQATLDFMYWCVTSPEGTKALCEDMGFVIPFKKNLPAANPLVNIANQNVADGFVPVSWNFPTMPSEEWKNALGSALTAYAAGTGDWDGVVSAFVDGWAAEYALIG